MKSAPTKLLAAGLLVVSTSLAGVRAEETYKPAETLGKPSQDPRLATELGVVRIRALHTNGLGKPCLDYELSSRPHAAIREVFDHVIGIRNRCPKSIKLRICPKDSKDSYECSGVAVRPYERKEVIMGFGPHLDRSAYSVKENP